MENVFTLKDKLKQLPFVKQASLSSCIPMSGRNSTTALTSKDSELKERFNVQYIYADNEYAETMSFELLAGRAAVNEIEEDTVQGFVVNETLIERLAFGTPEEALGKSINVHGYEANIIGVVKDFHTVSLHEEIKPVALIYGMDDFQLVGIKCQSDDMRESIAQLESTWKSVFPDKNMDYYFQDEQMGDMYDNDIRFSKVIQVFTIISILIAYIGLIGLSAFSSVKRFKEIGIRKVLGASVPSILFLMSKEFIVLTVISFLISIPLAYTFISGWLEGFAYSINIEWWMVSVAGISALLMTILIVSIQSMKAAITNPIKSLRSE